MGQGAEGIERHGLPVIKWQGDVTHSIRTIVNNAVIISCGDRWLTDFITVTIAQRVSSATTVGY